MFLWSASSSPLSLKSLSFLQEPMGWLLWGLHRQLSSVGLQSWLLTLLVFALLWRGLDLLLYLPYYRQSLQKDEREPAPGQLTTGLPPAVLYLGILSFRVTVFVAAGLFLTQDAGLKKAPLLGDWLGVATTDPWYILPILTGVVLLLAHREEWFQQHPDSKGRQLPVFRLSTWFLAQVGLFFLPAGLLWCLLLWALLNFLLALFGFWRHLHQRWSHPLS
jgi:hypothetical protein